LGKQVRDQFPLFVRQPMSNHDDSFHLSTWIATIRHIGKISTFQTEPSSGEDILPGEMKSFGLVTYKPDGEEVQIGTLYGQGALE